MSKTNFYRLSKVKNTSMGDLSKLVIDAIEQEQFFNKEVLVPKVKAILRGFHINLGTSKYNKIVSPSESAKQIRMIERMDMEIKYWKRIVKEHPNAPMQDHYDKLDILLKEYGFLEPEKQ